MDLSKLNPFAQDDSPNLTINPLDPATSGLIESVASRQSPQLNLDEGTAQAQAFMPKASGLTGQSGMGQAIAQKYGSIGQQEIDRIKSVQGLNKKESDFRAIGHSYNALMQKQQMNIQVYERQMNVYKQEVAARQAAINSIFGLGGMIAGAAVGGPMGAMAGQKIGQGMAGGSQPQANSFQSNLGNGNYNLGSGEY